MKQATFPRGRDKAVDSVFPALVCIQPNLEFRWDLEEVLAHEVGGTRGMSRSYPRGRTLPHRLSSEVFAGRVFIVQEGRPLFTVGAETMEGRSGQNIVVPPTRPHKCVNIGESQLRRIDIHASERFITAWLEH